MCVCVCVLKLCLYACESLHTQVKKEECVCFAGKSEDSQIFFFVFYFSNAGVDFTIIRFTVQHFVNCSNLTCTLTHTQHTQHNTGASCPHACYKKWICTHVGRHGLDSALFALSLFFFKFMTLPVGGGCGRCCSQVVRFLPLSQRRLSEVFCIQ